MSKRDKNIDNLRGLAMIVMILTHALVPYWASKSARFIWEWSHFSAPLFVFCSLAIHFAKPILLTWKSLFVYSKKRFIRLMIPYYVFIVVYFGLRFLLYDQQFDWNDFIQSLYLWSGDSSWLVILFLALSFLSPLVLFFFKKDKLTFYLFGLLSFISTIYFSFSGYDNFRIIMWLPWSMLLYFSLFFLKIKKNNMHLFLLFSSFTGLFIVLFVNHFYRADNNSLFQNKYPPDLYYLSYGLAVTSLLYLFSSIGLFKNKIISLTLSFFSINSYNLFFIHYLILNILEWIQIRIIYGLSKWYLFFPIVIGLSALTQILLNYLYNKTCSNKHNN